MLREDGRDQSKNRIADMRRKIGRSLGNQVDREATCTDAANASRLLQFQLRAWPPPHQESAGDLRNKCNANEQSENLCRQPEQFAVVK